MATKSKHTVEDLKDEITELKLSDIRKDITAVKDFLESKLNELISEVSQTKEHVKVTNGSVAKVTEQAIKLESALKAHKEEDNKNWTKLSEVEEETKVIRWIGKHPKIVKSIGILFLLPLGFTYFGDIKKFVAWIIKSFL